MNEDSFSDEELLSLEKKQLRNREWNLKKKKQQRNHDRKKLHNRRFSPELS